MRRAIVLLFAFMTLGLCACVGSSSQQRIETISTFASQNHWYPHMLHTGTMFDLVAFMPSHPQKSNIIAIYIEGDGLAWMNRRRLSRNPTPINPLGLKLAMKHREKDTVIYLSRPCQYIDLSTQPQCRQKYWSSHRFAPEVVTSTSAAIDILKDRYQATAIKLIGYSGGGAVAVLVGATRKDILHLSTIAGNLDTQAWVTEHDITPLEGSLNPADYWRNLVDIPQTHYVGSHDHIIPMSIANSYASHFPINKRPHIIKVKGYDHHCCWAKE